MKNRSVRSGTGQDRVIRSRWLGADGRKKKKGAPGISSESPVTFINSHQWFVSAPASGGLERLERFPEMVVVAPVSCRSVLHPAAGEPRWTERALAGPPPDRLDIRETRLAASLESGSDSFDTLTTEGV